MESIKIRIIALVFFVGGLLLTSCEDGVASNYQNNSTTQDSQDTIVSTTNRGDDIILPINKAELDSMKNDIENLKKQVGESFNRAEKYDTEIKNLKEQESSNKLYLLISIVLGLITLVISIIALIRASKFRKRLDKHGNDIYNLKQSSDNRFTPTPMPRQNSSDDYYQLKSRLKFLEEEVNTLKRSKNIEDGGRTSLYRPKSSPAPIPVVETKKGYFGQPTQADRGYFKNFLTTRDSEARFSAEEKDNIAEFEPLLNSRAELETLLRTDAAKLAVDFNGCSLQDANRAIVIKHGVAKLESNRWYIIQKALITLTR